MTQVPARLVYTDDGGTQQVIGSFQPSDPTEGNISTFTIEEDAKNYKRVIIEGAPELYDNMPSTVSEFEGDEKLVKAQIDSDRDGTWEDRVRVYPETGGVTNDRGKYKNENLWGFEKNLGEDDVEVTSGTNGPITTNLEDVLDALLPGGYTARYPNDITPPNVTNYTFNGSRQRAFNEIRKQYNHFIIFTAETDGSGNVYVDLQPKGYGGTQFSLVRSQDAYTYNNWKKNDGSNIISKVRVVGKDSNGNEVNRTVAAGTNTGVHGDDNNVDIYLGTPEPDRKKFKQISVDYIITETEAEEIAENLIEPTNTEHGEIEAELNADTTLNESVGINDENRTPANPIDDVFTVVKQKDFIHQGSTLYSFEFESEASQEQVDKWREHDSERAAVYPSGETDVGNQSLEVGDAAAQTTSSSDNNYDNGKAQTTSSSEAGTAKAQTSSSTTISTEDADDVNEPDIDSFTFNESLDGSGWDQLDNGSGKNTVTIQGDGLYHLVVLQFEISSDTDMDIAIVQDSTVIRHISPQQVGTQDSFTITNQTGQNHLRRAFYVPVDPFTTGSYDYECHISTKGGGTPTVDGRFQAFVRNHSHGASTTTTDSGHGDPSDPSTHSVSTSTTDSGHGGKGEDGDHNVTTSTTTTDSGHGSSNTDPHGGSTEDNVNVTTVNEDKTDR